MKPPTPIEPHPFGRYGLTKFGHHLVSLAEQTGNAGDVEQQILILQGVYTIFETVLSMPPDASDAPSLPKDRFAALCYGLETGERILERARMTVSNAR